MSQTELFLSGPFAQSGYSCVAEVKRGHAARRANAEATTEAMLAAVISGLEVLISRGQWVYIIPKHAVFNSSSAQTVMVTVVVGIIAKMQCSSSRIAPIMHTHKHWH